MIALAGDFSFTPDLVACFLAKCVCVCVVCSANVIAVEGFVVVQCVGVSADHDWL